ncbi:Ku protein [Streptomyces sp. NPDC004549]|uniref:non-homologous end joining protein Ku n=1 Tax=Streptomyces sp. NPDC004549 TaxID=3154283 RepID=UPI0033AB7A2E
MPQTASPGSTVWSGAISFGLVTVPVRVVSATQDRSVHLRQIHSVDGGRIRYRKICELEDREVPQSEIGRGYEAGPNQIIPISDQELRDLPLPTARAIEIVAFLPIGAVDPIRLGATGYYLTADGPVAAKPYKLLTQALTRSTKVAVARYAWSGRERLGLLRVRGDAIVLHPLWWPDEIRDPAAVAPPTAAVSDAEIASALALIDTMARPDLEGDDLRDTYRQAMHEVIDAKREQHPLPAAPEPQQPGQILDLMAALSRSVAQAREARGEPAEVHDLPAPAKKTAKEAPPRKKAASRRRGA